AGQSSRNRAYIALVTSVRWMRKAPTSTAACSGPDRKTPAGTLIQPLSERALSFSAGGVSRRVPGSRSPGASLGRSARRSLSRLRRRSSRSGGPNFQTAVATSPRPIRKSSSLPNGVSFIVEDLRRPDAGRWAATAGAPALTSELLPPSLAKRADSARRPPFQLGDAGAGRIELALKLERRCGLGRRRRSRGDERSSGLIARLRDPLVPRSELVVEDRDRLAQQLDRLVGAPGAVEQVAQAQGRFAAVLVLRADDLEQLLPGFAHARLGLGKLP